MLTAVEDPSTLDDAVAALDVRGNFMFDPATHRDFLGAIIGTGIVRDRIGVSRATAQCCAVSLHLHNNHPAVAVYVPGPQIVHNHYALLNCSQSTMHYWRAVTVTVFSSC